jgi:hypothetical protein
MKASYLLHIVRIMKLDSLRPTTAAEIDGAAKRWAVDDSPFRIAKHQQGSPVFFGRSPHNGFIFSANFHRVPSHYSMLC